MIFYSSSLQLKDYPISTLIHQGTKFVVFQGIQTARQKLVLLKLLYSEYPSFH